MYYMHVMEHGTCILRVLLRAQRCQQPTATAPMPSQRIGPSARASARVCHTANANLFFIFYPNPRIWGAFSFQLSADYGTERMRENVPRRKCIMCVYNMRQYHTTRHASAAQAPASWPKGFSLHGVYVFFFCVARFCVLVGSSSRVVNVSAYFFCHARAM